jgi:DNA-binding SARP family transcriptional activator
VFSLKLLGSVSLEGDGGPLSGPAVQRHRLALLALLSASPTRALARDKCMAMLWPERDQERARGLLNQAVHALRRTLGEDAILSTGEELQLNLGMVSTDVAGFEEAVSAGALERAAGLYTGPFLDGFFLTGAPEFEQWADGERQRLAASYGGVLESLAEQAGADKDWRRAVDWGKRRIAQDPYHSGAVERLMLALDASGNRAAALQLASDHQRLLREELAIEPSPEVQALTRRLRSSPAASAPFVGAPASSPEPAAMSVAAVSSPRRPVLLYVALALLLVALAFTAARLGSDRASPRSAANPSVDEIARAVATELARRQSGDTAVRLPQHRTASIPAYELYLRGNDPMLLRSDSGASQALEYFRRAVALDSGYASAWAGLARFSLRVRRPDRNLAPAEAAALRALALDDSLGEAHAVLGLVRQNQFRIAEAESHLLRAVMLEPGSSLYREYLGKIYLWTGRPADALASAERALALLPTSASANAEVARNLMANGRYDEALDRLRTIADLDPPLLRVPGIMALCYAGKGMWTEAMAAIRRQADQGGLTSLGVLGYLRARAGMKKEAAEVLATLLERARTEAAAIWPVALVYLSLGDLEEGVPWLERAIEANSLSPATEPPPLAVMVLDSLKGDPRIDRIRLRIGLQNR